MIIDCVSIVKDQTHKSLYSNLFYSFLFYSYISQEDIRFLLWERHSQSVESKSSEALDLKYLSIAHQSEINLLLTRFDCFATIFTRWHWLPVGIWLSKSSLSNRHHTTLFPFDINIHTSIYLFTFFYWIKVYHSHLIFCQIIIKASHVFWWLFVIYKLNATVIYLFYSYWSVESFPITFLLSSICGIYYRQSDWTDINI